MGFFGQTGPLSGLAVPKNDGPLAYAVRMGLPEIVIVVALLGLFLWALIDAVSRPEEQWRSAGESKWVWIILILVLQFIGPLAYLLWIRRKLPPPPGQPAS
jgi:hypothetical protein